MKTLVILNKQAGSHAKAQALIGQAAASEAIRFEVSESTHDLRRLVINAIEHGFEAVVAGGGDGTINELVNALGANIDQIRVGILPLGTGNDLSRSLGIPGDPAEALAAILSASPVDEERVDLIKVETTTGEKLCVNVVSGGLGGEIQKATDPSSKQRWRGLSYARAALSAATELKEYKLRLTLDGIRRVETSALNLIIGNGRTAGGGFEVAPEASVRDAELDIVIVHPAGLPKLAAIATQLMVGDYTNSDAVSQYRAKTVLALSVPPMDLSVDGTLYGTTPASFRVLPQALRLIGSKTSKQIRKTA